MTSIAFKATLSQESPPENLSVLLKALWFDAKNDWESAHDIAQSDEGSKSFDHLHAYLHRKEGDAWNAKYWYNRAKEPVFSGSFQEEWEHLFSRFSM